MNGITNKINVIVIILYWSRADDSKTIMQHRYKSNDQGEQSKPKQNEELIVRSYMEHL